MNAPHTHQSPVPPVVAIRNLTESLRTIFGESPQGRALRQRCSGAIGEIESFEDHRGVKSTVVAVIGSKNSGKSWLCRQLVRDEAKRALIPSGEESAGGTAKALWIGPDAPPGLVADHESRVAVRREAMEDLGRDYTLLDLPGYDDAEAAVRNAALQALRGVYFRVMVISSATKQIESQLAYLADSDGTHILPLVVDGHFPLLETDGRAEVDALVARIRRHCPQAVVATPVVIPHIGHAPGDPAANLSLARERTLAALRAFVASDPVDETLAARVVVERLRRGLADDLRGFVERVAPAHEALEIRETALAGELVAKILGSDAQLAAGLRMRMRLHALSLLPAGFFPYRSLFGLFALTAGAWDRLAFSLGGSLPSLALLAFQGARNVKRLGETREEVRNALADRLQSMADDDLADLNRVFIRAIRATLPPGGAPDETEAAPTRFRGLDHVTRGSTEIFDAAIRRHSRTRGFAWFTGGFATLVFLALLAGPVATVYQEFLAAWLGVLAGDRSVRWQDFPAPSAAMIFASALLVVLPVVFLALVGCIAATPARRIEAAMLAVKQEHQALLERLARGQTVRLVSDDPLREAVRHLLAFLKGLG